MTQSEYIIWYADVMRDQIIHNIFGINKKNQRIKVKRKRTIRKFHKFFLE